MKKFVILALLICVMVGCSNNDDLPTDTMTGEITKITKKQLYIDHKPLNVKDNSEFEVGQRVRVTYSAKKETEAWFANDIIVKDVQILE